MSDAYCPAGDIAMMADGPRSADARGPFPERVLSPAEVSAYRARCTAAGVKFTDGVKTGESS